MSDQELHDFFISLLEKNLGIILKISKAYTSTLQDREDLVNDIAYELYKAMPAFRGEARVSTWIYRIALNTAMNFSKRARRSRDFIKSAIDLNPPVPTDERHEDPQIELLYECIAELEVFSKAIILLYLDGYKHVEIAEITGISKTNVGTRISRIKEELKNLATKKHLYYGTG